MQTIKLREITPTRIIIGVGRRLADIPHAMAWNARKGLAAENRARLEQLRDKHAGERCFILGNGPSLGRTDLSRLVSEYSFGSNRLYLMFDQTDYRPTYYASVNDLVAQQYGAEMAKLDMVKFFNWNHRHLYQADDQLLFVKGSLWLRDQFQPDITRPIGAGGTVTIVHLHIAFFMGFKQVVLIGVDHDFAEKGTPNKTVENKQDDVNHFHPDYFPKGSKWQLPDFQKERVAYRRVKDYYEAHGREVVDATIGGKLPVFRKVDYDSLF